MTEPRTTIGVPASVFGTGLRTVVKWTLETVDGGVLVRMEQSGFREQDQRNFMGARYGWERNLGQLEAVVARMA